ncbi:MAG: thiol:disulfide interchange protein DsbA/DsbL [Burkholderiales bacterium]|nr:thiol:disulfide interchange protein DsbA/DsbL [Burkholderiales bacterium]
MSKWLSKIGVLLFTALVFTASHAQRATPLNPPQPVENDGKVEVLEFFAYGCIHCANLEPALEAWARKQPADVKVKRIPSPVPIMGIDSTILYYSLEALGQLDRLHAKIFTAAHLEKVVIGNPAMLNKWLEKNGVDPKKYEEVQKSFSVSTKVQRARKMVEDYKIHATPTIVVNGRFSIEQGSAGAEAMFANVDQLVKDARATLKVSAAPAPVVAATSVAAKPDLKKAAAIAAK